MKSGLFCLAAFRVGNGCEPTTSSKKGNELLTGVRAYASVGDDGCPSRARGR